MRGGWRQHTVDIQCIHHTTDYRHGPGFFSMLHCGQDGWWWSVQSVQDDWLLQHYRYPDNIYTISTHPRHNWARPIFNTGWCQPQLHFQLCRLSGRLSSNMNKYNGHNPRHRNITDVSTATSLSAPQHHSIIRQVSWPLVSRALVWIEVVLSPALGLQGRWLQQTGDMTNILNESYWIIWPSCTYLLTLAVISTYSLISSNIKKSSNFWTRER